MNDTLLLLVYLILLLICFIETVKLIRNLKLLIELSKIFSLKSVILRRVISDVYTSLIATAYLYASTYFLIIYS